MIINSRPNSMNFGDLDPKELKLKCPLPKLMKKLGYKMIPTRSYSSPFRPDENPSWGYFEKNGQWFWKDLATGDCGDEITFLARHFKKDPKTDFPELLQIYAGYTRQDDGEKDEPSETETTLAATEQQRPDLTWFGLGTEEQIQMVSQTRNIKPEALEWARDRGVLKFGVWHNYYKVYGVTDLTGKAVGIRNVNNEPFAAGGGLPERKAHNLKHSVTNWPVGLIEVKDCPMLFLVEGVPDFLAAHQVIIEEAAIGRVGPICMLSASCSIGPEAAPYMKGKHVRIAAQADAAGINAAWRWERESRQAGAAKVDTIDLSRVKIEDHKVIKDLNDFLPYYSRSITMGERKWRLLF